MNNSNGTPPVPGGKDCGEPRSISDAVREAAERAAQPARRGHAGDYDQPRNVDRPAIMRFFRWEHLPSPMRHVSQAFADLAEWMIANIPDSAERAAGLRKLLEAKDCAVRAALP